MRAPSILATALIAATTILVTSGVRANDGADTTYSTDMATTQTVYPGGPAATFDFIATSPTLPKTGPDHISPYTQPGCPGSAPGVLANFIAKDLTYTDQSGTSGPFDFSSWIALSPTANCYNADQQAGPNVIVTIAVPSNAALGTYDAKLAADGPNGIGWGEGAGVHITLTVQGARCPVPNVAFIGPTDGSRYKLGNRVPVDFTATDAQCAVLATDATLTFLDPGDPNPPASLYTVDISSLLSAKPITNGVEEIGSVLTSVPPGAGQTILQIGSYQLGATATSAGGTSTPVTDNFTVNYDINPLPPAMTASSLTYSRSSRSCTPPFQVKFQALAVQPADTSTSNNTAEAFVNDHTVLAVIVDAGNNVIASANYTGNPNTGFSITGVTGDTGTTLAADNYLWKPSFNACQLQTGTYTISVYFNDAYAVPYLQYSKQFTVTN
jgi:hypothetical protein